MTTESIDPQLRKLVDWDDLIGQDMSASEAKDSIRTIQRAINTHYISKAKVLEAIGEDEEHNYPNFVCPDCGFMEPSKIRNRLRDAIKKELNL